MDNQHDYLTTREAAQYIGVSDKVIRRWIRNGRLPAYRDPLLIKGWWQIRRADVEWFKQLKQRLEQEQSTRSPSWPGLNVEV